MTTFTTLPPILLDAARLCLWFVALMAVFVPLERILGLRRQRIFRRAFGVDVIYYFVSGLVPKLLLAAPLSFAAALLHRAVPSGYYDSMAALPLAVRLGASMIVGEIGAYWGHRWSHEIPWLWRFHAIHHDAEEVDWLVHTRVHPVDLIFTRLCGLLPLYAFGLVQPAAGSPDLAILWLTIVGAAWGFFIHSNLRLRFGALEYLVATPAFHHWHHTNDGAAYINKNYAPLFPWIDRLFQTLYLPGNWPAVYGIDSPLSPDFSVQLVEPFFPQNHSPTASVEVHAEEA